MVRKKLPVQVNFFKIAIHNVNVNFEKNDFKFFASIGWRHAKPSTINGVGDSKLLYIL